MSNDNSGWGKIADQERESVEKAKKQEKMKTVANVADHALGAFARVMIGILCILLLAVVFVISSRS